MLHKTVAEVELMTMDEFLGWCEFLRQPEEPVVELSAMSPDALAKMFGGDS
jgi:hypothetical protein